MYAILGKSDVLDTATVFFTVIGQVECVGGAKNWLAAD